MKKAMTFLLLAAFALACVPALAAAVDAAADTTTAAAAAAHFANNTIFPFFLFFCFAFFISSLIFST